MINQAFIQIARHILKSRIKQSHCYLRYKSSDTRKYTNRHEWIILEQDIGTVGITKYAQAALGDIVFAQLPEPGTNIIVDEECGALESVKAASEIYSPVSGVVVEKNALVEKTPVLINSSCLDEGWLFKLRITKHEEFKNLMSEEDYLNFLKQHIEKEH